MFGNQRARLVLNPVSLIVLLVATGLGIGIGLSIRRDGGSASQGSSRRGEAGARIGITLSSDRLDFGDIPLDHVVVRRLLLRNNGSDPVRLRLQTSKDVFSLDQDELTLGAGRAARVAVSASPKIAGALEDELRIAREDAPDDAIVVALGGTARGPGDTRGLATSGTGADPAGIDVAGRQDLASSRGADGDAESEGLASARYDEPQGSIQITRSTPGGSAGAAAATGGHGQGQAPGMVVVPFDAAASRPRSMADAPTGPSSNDPPGEEEEPVPVARRKSDDDRPKEPTSPPTAPTFSVFADSTLLVHGSSNSLSPQQVGVFGSAGGGSFSLSGSIQLPRIPLGFGQSMTFHQIGSAVGSFDPSSGQVVLQLAIVAEDSNGRRAPVMMPQLTTGTVVARNEGGVLMSTTGSPRSGSGELRLAGMGKIERGHGNMLEDHLVFIDIHAMLGFPAAPETEAANDTGGDGGGGR